MNFREADVADVESIARLHAASWRNTYRGILRNDFLDGDLVANRIELWTRRFHSPEPSQFVLIAERDSNVTGFACVYGAHDSQLGSMLDNLHVQPTLKSQGIGTQLIGRAAQWSLRTHPKCGLHLWVFDGNDQARNFYERLGGTHSESIEADVPGGGRAIEHCYTWSDVAALVKVTGLPLES